MRCEEVGIYYFNSHLGRSVEHFNKTSKKFQTPGFGVFEDYLCFRFLKNSEKIQPTGLYTMNQKQKFCPKISPQILQMFSKRKLQIHFQRTSGRTSLRGAEKFRIKVLNQLYAWQSNYARELIYMSRLCNSSCSSQN